MKTPRLVLYGHFGTGNIGNDSTLEAMLYNIRKYQPSAIVNCVCSGPQVIAQRFGIETVPFDITEDRNTRIRTGSFLAKFVRITNRIFDEINFWFKRTRWFQSVDQFIVVGTGALDDMAVVHPWNAPYDLFKWCYAAKFGGSQVVFLSVGAGPIMNRVSRALMLRALQTADYRSYRDSASLEYLRNVGFNTTGDSIYPDLVYSLPDKTGFDPFSGSTHSQTVGLGVISYYGWRHDPAVGEPIFQNYLAKLKQFVQWLLEQGYFVRLLYGDTTDQRTVDELFNYVRKNPKTEWQDRIFAEPIKDLNDLFEQIAKTDVVVASRFHNVLCSLMLGKPVISIGYHSKNELILAEVGLESYCQHIESFEVDWLIQKFQLIVADSARVSNTILQKCAQNRQLLDEQYQKLLLHQAKEKPISSTSTSVIQKP